METKEVISKIWPPKDDAIKHVTLFRHRDGRTIRYVSGPCVENEKQLTMLKDRGNIAGTFGSIAYFEAFSDEPVCCGCVAIIEQYGIRPSGVRGYLWNTSHAQFNTGIRSDYCENCRKREIEELNKRFEHDLRLLSAMALIRPFTPEKVANAEGSTDAEC